MLNKIKWEIDLLIYRLFRKRWNERFKNDSNLRKLFLKYLNAWEAVENEPEMGIGKNPPKMPHVERDSSKTKQKRVRLKPITIYYKEDKDFVYVTHIKSELKIDKIIKKYGKLVFNIYRKCDECLIMNQNSANIEIYSLSRRYPIIKKNERYTHNNFDERLLIIEEAISNLENVINNINNLVEKELII